MKRYLIVDRKDRCFIEIDNLNINEIDFAESQIIRECPTCGSDYYQYPAISRKDNKTEICPTCGTIEAMEDFLGGNRNV